MKAIRAKILMVALVVTTLVVSALAQQPDSGSPRPKFVGGTVGPFPDDAGALRTQQPDSGSPRPESVRATIFPFPDDAGALGTMYTVPDGGITRFLPSNHAAPLTNYAYGRVTSAEVKLANEVNQLIQQLGEAKSDSDRDKIKTKLGEVLEKQFDQRQKRHEQEIEALEAQIKKLKDLIQKRQENRREIIVRRLDQILRESQGLGW